MYAKGGVFNTQYNTERPIDGVLGQDDPQTRKMKVNLKNNKSIYEARTSRIDQKQYVTQGQMTLVNQYEHARRQSIRIERRQPAHKSQRELYPLSSHQNHFLGEFDELPKIGSTVK